MKVKHDIDDTVLLAAVAEHYRIAAEHLTFIPMGDSAYAYRIDGANGERYFLKLFDAVTQQRSIKHLDFYLPLTWQLAHNEKLQQIVAPIRGKQGSLYATLNNRILLVLYPYIEGPTLADAYPFPAHIVEQIATFVARLHSLSVQPAQNGARKETFDLSFEPQLIACLDQLSKADDAHRFGVKELKRLVLPRREQIIDYLELVRKLRVKLSEKPFETVLCHGDIWGGNMIEHEGRLHFVDWETAIFAPRERDLFKLTGESFDIFLSVYTRELGRPVSLNIDLLRYYSYRRHLENLTNWLMNILHRNRSDVQSVNDLEMIADHCLDRFSLIEPQLKTVRALQRS